MASWHIPAFAAVFAGMKGLRVDTFLIDNSDESTNLMALLMVTCAMMTIITFSNIFFFTVSSPLSQYHAAATAVVPPPFLPTVAAYLDV